MHHGTMVSKLMTEKDMPIMDILLWVSILVARLVIPEICIA